MFLITGFIVMLTGFQTAASAISSLGILIPPLAAVWVIALLASAGKIGS